MPRDHARKSCWMHSAASDQEYMGENHVDPVVPHVILDSLQALPGLLLLGRKAKQRTVARPGGESGKKCGGSRGLWETKPEPGEGGEAERTAGSAASCPVVTSSHLQPVI